MHNPNTAALLSPARLCAARTAREKQFVARLHLLSPIPFLLRAGGLAGEYHCDCRTSSAVGDLQHFCGALANDDARRHRVAGCGARHDGTVSDPKIIDPMDLERAVHYRHRVVSHLGRTCLMPIAACHVADEVLECGAFEIAWHHLSLDERAQRP